jgi:peptidoglycan/xylan/chitin deacetylase (PgdA/CDA1 family)
MLERTYRRVVQALRARRSIILCYHGVGPSTTRTDPGFLRVDPDAFSAQLELLLGAGFEFVTVAELAERGAGAEPPPGLVALSFDDGMDDNHKHVLPILRERGLRATVYVITGLIGEPNPWMASGSGARMMTAAELQDLVQAGFEVGAHSVTHPDLSQLDFETCLREMTESRTTLENLLGTRVQTFAYPYCRYGPAALAAARAAGFAAAVTCEGRGTWERYELARSMITGKDSLIAFVAKLSGLYQPLFDSAPGRIVRGATRGLRERRRHGREERAALREREP